MNGFQQTFCQMQQIDAAVSTKACDAALSALFDASVTLL